MRILTSQDVAALLRSPPRRPNPRAIAERNRLQCLRAIARHGHLRTCDLATLWLGAKYAEQMSRRTVAALLRTGEIICRTNAHGGRSFVLSRIGAAYLEVRGHPAHHGLDLASVSGSTFYHNALTSRYCLMKATEGYDAYPEYSIALGHAPITKSQLIDCLQGKMPDGILVRDRRIYLVETESAPKADLSRVVGLAEAVGRKITRNGEWVVSGLYIVFSADQNHGSRIIRAARSRWHDHAAETRRLLASHVKLCRVTLGLPLVWLASAEGPLQI